MTFFRALIFTEILVLGISDVSFRKCALGLVLVLIKNLEALKLLVDVEVPLSFRQVVQSADDRFRILEAPNVKSATIVRFFCVWTSPK